MKFAIDVDGCLADFQISFAKILQRIQPIKVDIYDSSFPCCWDWMDYYGWDKETTARAWTEAENCGYFWKMLHPYPTVHADLKRLDYLRGCGHEVYFVTHRRGKTAKVETEDWLSARGMTNPSVIICEGDKKGDLCATLGINLIVDDAPSTLLKVPEGIKTILMARPWNKDYQEYFNQTVTSIREALDVV